MKESLANKKKNDENPVVRTGAVEVAVLGQIAIDPTINTRRLVAVSGMNRTSA